MSIELNKAVARRMYEDFWGQGRYDLVEELFTHDFVNYQHYLQPFGAFANDLQRGPLAYMHVVQAWRNGFPDSCTKIDDQIAERDRVVTRWRTRGTHQGSWMGIEATGREVEVAGISIDRFFGGRVCEKWASWDLTGLLEQLGVTDFTGAANRKNEVLLA